MFAKYRSVSLILRIIIGLVIGAALAVIFPKAAFIGVMGQLFVGALKGIAPVMVFFLILSAISAFREGGENHFGSVIELYLSATLLSAFAAVAASWLFPLKLNLPKSVKVAANAPKSLGKVIEDLLVNAVGNPLDAIVNANYLSILFWALLIGFMLRLASKQTRQTITEISDAIIKVAQLVIEFAPFGICGLIYTSISETGFASVAKYGQLVLLLVGTMAAVYLILYPLMVFVMTGQNPYPLTLWTLKVSGIPAFFTRSSAVNIPINLQACEDLGLNKESYAVSITLGGSANSGGAAITVSVMTLAACATLGIHVSFFLAVILCILTALAATGASGIAGGSLLIIPMAASIFGISNDIAMQVVGVGFIIGVIQDSVETAVNSASDLLFAAAAEWHDVQKATGKKVDIKAAVRNADHKQNNRVPVANAERA
ncbi:serine/threonine transporter SstT [Lacticaseibacillus manihotivorans]|uniref:Serine/threonine transporter SstT n=2 Tax=Lacticaseibacillus manihotivorans TaxID=88233 RepID=A0A0R1QBD5_9LACO|nr:serine/threonine transporter SstT [Lacticaseibacillus manihotivorans]KRL41903.1 serine threonine transporter SstT [Lacticaseibacillus manihotivorans DSM 13343 = JCM 12514]QFQ90372.1 serine/threonine transporter SstT [Lacticaseibacillus manihotivorans]